MRSTLGKFLSNSAPGSFPFKLDGGRYQMAAAGTFGGGNTKLQQLMPDGATFVDVPSSTISAAGVSGIFDLPPGQYQIVITTSTAMYVSLVRIPYD